MDAILHCARAMTILCNNDCRFAACLGRAHDTWLDAEGQRWSLGSFIGLRFGACKQIVPGAGHAGVHSAES